MKKVENEKCTTQDLEYSERTEKRGKRETDTVGPGIWQKKKKKKKKKTKKKKKNEKKTLKNMENEKHTLQDLEYGEKH